MNKGQVATPPGVVDLMVRKLFDGRRPSRNDRVLDPGCGSGGFIKGILDWCDDSGNEIPSIVGVESDSSLLEAARKNIGQSPQVALLDGDFLLQDFGQFDFVIGNPPYVRLEQLSQTQRETYRKKFATATDRFDLFSLFFEKALRSLKPWGRLVFITPEKFEYTLSTRPLRRLLGRHHVEEIHHIDERTFGDLVTYPAITVVTKGGKGSTRVIRRDNSVTTVTLPIDGSQWISVISGHPESEARGVALWEICRRISCGVATGADDVFVMSEGAVPRGLESYSHPAVSGRDLTVKGIDAVNKIIVPYSAAGVLPEAKLQKVKEFLSAHKKALSSRYCVRKGKRKWYEYHETPPMKDILRPKILCKDIAKEPRFWADRHGNLFPRHSVYYIVPRDPMMLDVLLDYLNSSEVQAWLIAKSQRAANDFVRLQSSVLKHIPVPRHVVERKLANKQEFPSERPSEA